MVVVDADFLVAIQQGHAGAARLAERLLRGNTPLRIPAAAWAEFMTGIPAARRHDVAANLERAASLHPFGRAEAEAAAVLQGDRLAKGSGLAWHDLQMAATAIALDAPLVSNDAAFRRVPGLEVMTY